MAQYIDRDVLTEKLWERRIKHRDFGGSPYSEYGHEDDEILSLINSLGVKEVNLEEKATQLSQKYFPNEENIWARPNIEAQRCKSACIEMAEWLKAQKGE